MSIDVEKRDGIVQVKLAGKLLQEEAEALENLIGKQIDDENVRIVIDLSGLDFISSDGLSALLEIRMRLQHEDGFIRLVCPPELVLQVFQRTRLTKIFQIYPDLDTAVTGGDSAC